MPCVERGHVLAPVKRSLKQGAALWSADGTARRRQPAGLQSVGPPERRFERVYEATVTRCPASIVYDGLMLGFTRPVIQRHTGTACVT